MDNAQTQAVTPTQAPKGAQSKGEEIIWAVKPRSLFVGVITAVCVTAAMIVAGVYIGRDLSMKSPSETRLSPLELGRVENKLQEIGATLTTFSKLPQQMTFQLPKEAFRMELTLPDAPPPQPIHVHTREVTTNVVTKEGATESPKTQAQPPELPKEAKEPAKDMKKSEARAPEATKKVVELKPENLLPPPKETEAWKEWTAAQQPGVKKQ